MPAPTTITIIQGRLAVGVDAATLTAFDCQVVSAALTANPNLQPVPATFCAPASETPAATGWQLDINWLQDWSDPAGVSWWTFDHDTEQVFWELSLDSGATPDEPIMHGEARVVAMGFGGDAGTPLQATVTWPVIGKPVKGPWPASVASEVSEVDAEPAAAGVQ